MPLAPPTTPLRLLLVILLTTLALTRPSHAQQDLPTNPLIRQGVLANGLRYTVVRHPAACGAPPRVALSLRADFGSLDEDDHERGSARATELLARASIFAAPTAAALRDLGVQPETDLQSNVGYEWCAISLAVPATAPSSPAAASAVRAALETLARAFAKPPDSATSAEGWTNLRAMLEDRERAAMGTALRANTTLLPRLMPESRYATRFPMGPGSLDPKLSAATAEAFRAKWLVPSNATLVVAGDGIPLDDLEALTRAVFSRVPTGPRPTRQPIGPVEAKQPTALVLHDPGLATDFVQLTRGIAPPATGIDSTSRFSGDLAHRVLVEIISRRIDAAAPSAPGVRRAIMPRISRSFTLSAVIAGGPQGSAPTLARALIETTRDLQSNPVGDAELEAARAAVLSALDTDARTEPSLSPEKIADRYNDAVSLRDAPLSAAQRSELARTLIGRVTADTVAAAARERLDLNHAALVALLPAPSPQAPEAHPLTEAALLTAFDTPAPPAQPQQALAAGAAEHAIPTDPAHTKRGTAKPQPPITDFLAAEPPADAIAAVELHPPSGVFSASFTNAAVFHHRAMPSAPSENAAQAPTGKPSGRIVLTLAFGVGPADETPDTRSLSTIALAALKEPAITTIDAAGFRRVLDESALTTDVLLAADAVSLVINAPADRASAAFAFAAAIASQGTLDRAVFERARARMETVALQGMRTPEFAVADLYARAVFPSDSRVRAASADDTRAMDFDTAADFVRRVLTTSPLEIAVTGDIDRAAALSLATSAFAPLPTRPIITTDPTAVTLPAPAGPLEATQAIDTADGRSVVLEGFRSADESDTASVAALDAAAEALSARLTNTLRERLRLSTSVRVEHIPARGWRNAGDFRAVASCAAGREAELRTALRAALTELVSAPLDPAELASARQRVAARRAEELSDPQWWSARLAHANRRTSNLDDFLSAPARTLALSADDVLATMKRFATDHRRVSLTVTPR